jgi:hypothetical protein
MPATPRDRAPGHSCLTVTDEFTKEGLAIGVDGRIRSARVIEVHRCLDVKRMGTGYIEFRCSWKRHQEASNEAAF